MTAPGCAAASCAGVPDDGKGFCPAHRRSLTLSTQMQDSVRDFLNGTPLHLPESAIPPTTENTQNIIEAGQHLAQALALLISTRFEVVSFDPKPIALASLTRSAHTAPWRVRLSWQGHQQKASALNELDDEYDDELDDELDDEPGCYDDEIDEDDERDT